MRPNSFLTLFSFSYLFVVVVVCIFLTLYEIHINIQLFLYLRILFFEGSEMSDTKQSVRLVNFRFFKGAQMPGKQNQRAPGQF